jgi:hypothetical protein
MKVKDVIKLPKPKETGLLEGFYVLVHDKYTVAHLMHYRSMADGESHHQMNRTCVDGGYNLALQEIGELEVSYMDLKCPICDSKQIDPESLSAIEVVNVLERFAQQYGYEKIEERYLDPKIFKELSPYRLFEISGGNPDKYKRLMLKHGYTKIKGDICVWSQDSDDGDTWDTGCGEHYIINDGTPEENNMKFCTFCGLKVEQSLCKSENS